MTIEEELRTAYANLKGHQERSLGYIRRIDELAEENRKLRQRMEKALDIVKNWMEMARLGRIKVGDRVLTTEECEIVRGVLSGVAGEIEVGE